MVLIIGLQKGRKKYFVGVDYLKVLPYIMDSIRKQFESHHWDFAKKKKKKKRYILKFFCGGDKKYSVRRSIGHVL